MSVLTVSYTIEVRTDLFRHLNVRRLAAILWLSKGFAIGCREIAHKVLGSGDLEEGRHVHMALDGAEEQQLHVEPSEMSASSVGGRSDASMTSGYSSGYDSETAAPSRSSSFAKLRPSAPRKPPCRAKPSSLQHGG